MPEGFEIRSMLPADVEMAADVVLDGGWGDRRTFFRFAVDQPGCRAVVATFDGGIVGTGVGTINGRTGWVGTIFVAPAARRRGLGRALTESVIQALRAAGCESLVLAASAEGEPLYGGMGFRTTGSYEMLAAQGLGSGAGAAAGFREAGDWPGATIRPFDAADLPAICATDLDVTGEDRSDLLDVLVTPRSTRLVEGPDGRIAGFLVRPPWSGGAVIAGDPRAAIALLEERRAGTAADRQTRTALLGANRVGLAALSALGWTAVGGLPRMAIGPDPLRRPEAIWGQLNFALG